MVGTMQSRSYGATYGAASSYGASNADVRGWVTVKSGQIVGMYGDDSAAAKAHAKSIGGYAANKTGAGIPFGVESGAAAGALNFLTQGVQAVTQLVGQKQPQQAPQQSYAPAPKAAKSNTMLYVAGGVVVVAVLGAGVYFATRKRGR